MTDRGGGTDGTPDSLRSLGVAPDEPRSNPDPRAEAGANESDLRAEPGANHAAPDDVDILYGALNASVAPAAAAETTSSPSAETPEDLEPERFNEDGSVKAFGSPREVEQDLIRTGQLDERGWGDPYSTPRSWDACAVPRPP